ncbi:CSNK2B [Lepeophtheirus salmonis]|uniref:Casein kinase II subunit beta n=1 Tax=Lepeophtheirus salmonis TaxID=72036 RepID=A0A7R8H6X2_LEPSM|nr:CSNK2B [Lepeophtheirus salmonis]CAF2911783.1 CSNK2B [Lepeophtheirus salmonis]
MEYPRSLLKHSSDRSYLNEPYNTSYSETCSYKKLPPNFELPWVDIYVRTWGNEFFVRVPDSYMHQNFNLTGLESILPTKKYFYETVDYIIGIHSDSESDGRIHYDPSWNGNGQDKFLNVVYGRCPRIYCQGTPTLPIGLSDCWSDHLGVKIYCPSCDDIYHPQKRGYKDLNGAGFGRSFPHNFLMHYPRPLLILCNIAYPNVGIVDFVLTSSAKRLKVGTDGNLCYSTDNNFGRHIRCRSFGLYSSEKKKKYSKRKPVPLADEHS